MLATDCWKPGLPAVFGPPDITPELAELIGTSGIETWMLPD